MLSVLEASGSECSSLRKLRYYLALSTTQGQSHEKTYPCLFSAFRELRLGGLAKDW